MSAENTECVAVLEGSNLQVNLFLGKYLVGSGEKCDIIINDSTVDQRHAFLVVKQHCIKIIDMLTETGTYVDNENICNEQFNDISKSVSIKFGSFVTQLRLIKESDFMGFTSRDSLDIIPLSPQGCTTTRRNSEVFRSRIRSKESSIRSDFPTRNTPSVNSSGVNKLACNDFLADVTDENIRRTIEQMTEEDEYYVPETQEIFERRPQNPKDNTSDGIFRITTQEFKGDSNESITSNVMDANASLNIPLIRHSPILITEFKYESATICNTEQETRSEEPSAEMSILKWNESANNSAALDGLKTEEQIKEESSTPDLELTQIRSGSTTPDIFHANESSIGNVNTEEHVLSPTQIFQPKKSSNEKQLPLNTFSNNPNKDPNLKQPVVLIHANLSPTTNSPQLLKNDRAIFAKPLPKRPITIIDSDSEDYNNAGPTQPFTLKRSEPPTSANDDFDQFPETQRFEFAKPKRQSENSTLILSSVEENEEYCSRETLCIGERKISTNKEASKKGSRQLAQDDDIFYIQPTPTDVIKLPNESIINNVENLFNREKHRKRRASFSEDSSDEDDSVFTKDNKELKKDVKKKNIVVRLKRDRKSDEQNLLLNDPKNVHKKDSLSDQSTSNDGTRRRRGRPKKVTNLNDQSTSNDGTRRRRGRPKKVTNSNDKKSDKVEKQQISKSPYLEKNVEGAKMSGDAIRNLRDQKKYIKNTDCKSEEAKKEKTEVPLKKTRSKTTTASKNVPQKACSSKVGYTKSEYGDSGEERPMNLHCRTSGRIRNIPSYRVHDYYTGSDLGEKIKELEKLPKTSRRKAVAKNLKQDPKKYPNLQKSSSSTSMDESEKSDKLNEAAPKCTSGRNLFHTSTPSVQKSAQERHHICFTRLDSSSYANIMQKTNCKIENDPMNSTILVAAKITRTWKMLAAIARGLPIVSPDWFKILESNYNASYSYDDYLLQDPSAEQQYKFNLKKSLQAARKKPIFKNFTFLITPQTQPNPAEMKKIIESGGGCVVDRFPRDIEDLSDFYIISTREDDALWKIFMTNAANVSIYSSEAVMSAVMQQCINFKHHQLL